MMMDPPSGDDHSKKRKKVDDYVQKGLGAFAGLTRKGKTIFRGKEVTFDLKTATTVHGPTAADMHYKCEHCGEVFKNSQGLGSHENKCQKALIALKESIGWNGI